MKAVTSKQGTVFSHQGAVIGLRQWVTRSVLECGGKRSATPLSHGRAFSDRVKPLSAPNRRRRVALPAQSKNWRRLVLLAFCFLPSAFCFRATGQSYSIDWFKIAGGGGISTGSVYSVSGSIGQLDAGAVMTGGNYTLTGGFWSLQTVVQTPGAPKLTIATTTTNTLVIAWPSPSTGFTLQTNLDLGTTNWGDVPALFDNGTSRFAVVNPAIGNRFYRLFKP